MDTETIAKALGNAKQVNGQWVASCPVPGHGRGNGDKNPSLSITESEGKVLFHCHGGCDQRDVFDAVRARDLLPTIVKREEISFTQHQAPVLEKEWLYRSEDGDILFTKRRYKTSDAKGKTYSIHRVDSTGKRIAGLKDTRIVPYQLPELLDAKTAGRAIYLVEGEKAADALISIGAIATTSHTGAGSWPAEITQYFAGANIVVIPDHDEPGRSYARRAIQNLLPVAKSIRYLDLDLMMEGDDAHEWVHDMKGTRKELAELAKQAPIITKELAVTDSEQLTETTQTEQEAYNPTPQLLNIEAWDTIKDEPVEWIIDNVLPNKGFCALYGPPGSYKSFIALDIAEAVATGRPWMGNQVTNPGGVLYIAGEGHGGIGARIKACKIFKNSQGGEPLFVIRNQINLRSNHEDFLALIESIDAMLTNHELSLSLVIIDTLARSFGGGNENSSEDMGAFITQCGRLMDRYQCTLMLLHHSGKDIAKGLRGHSSLLGAVDTELELVRVDSMIKSTEIAGQGILTITKQKDGEDNRKIGFEVVPVVLKSSGIGLEDITSLAVQSSDSVVRDRQEQAKSGRGSKAGKGKNQRLEMQSLKIAMNSKGYSSSTPEGFKKVVDLEFWRQEFSLMVREKDTSDDTFNKAWVRCKKNLQESGLVRVRGNLVWMVRDEDQKEEF